MGRVASLLLILVLAVPTGAGASVTVGPANPNPDPIQSQSVNYGKSIMLFTAVGPPGTQLSSPIDGIVTRWRFYTHSIGGPGATAQLRVLEPGAANAYTGIASSAAEPLAPVQAEDSLYHNVFHEFSSRVPIGPGQVVGLVLSRPDGSFVLPVTPVYTGWGFACMGPVCSSGEKVPANGETETAVIVNGMFMAFNADVEPDADADGYGDETQDNCRGVANANQADSDSDGLGDACDLDPPTQDPAPVIGPVQVTGPVPAVAPDTALARGPQAFAAAGRRAKVQFAFSSDDPVAGFECSLDGAPFVACTSPKSYRVKAGRHNFWVRAKGAAGSVDPTPASRSFKVSRLRG